MTRILNCVAGAEGARLVRDVFPSEGRFLNWYEALFLVAKLDSQVLCTYKVVTNFCESFLLDVDYQCNHLVSRIVRLSRIFVP